MTQEKSYYIQPGYIFVSKEPYILSTVLGSCVAICIWDRKYGYGGMNHYIYNKPLKGDRRTTEYGSVSIPHLIKLMKNMGSNLKDLKVHMIGGAKSTYMPGSTVGKDNIMIAEKILLYYDLEIVTRDTGGIVGKKVVFNNKNGEARIYKVNNIRGSDWYGKD